MFTRVLGYCALLLISSQIALANEAIDFRLPTHIQPTLQRVTLNVDPDKQAYDGFTQIELTITETTNRVSFYKKDLDIQDIFLVAKDQTLPLQIEPAKYDIHHGVASRNLVPGKYQLNISFKGKVNKKSDGMYLSDFEGRNYISTQFQDMHARKTFPSFDEPSFKFPYQLTIQTPKKHTVVANTPVAKREVNGDLQTVTFKQTKPMPSYIIAFAIGEWDAIDIPELSVPGKIYAPKGHAHRALFAAKHTGEILRFLEEYFGSKYPYEKLDFIAVPNFTFGAMENPGLVTYQTGLLLLPDEPTLTEQDLPLMVIAHELAHMWYGNLVTMAWWNDLWLNEAFASWMASKVMMNLYPEQNYVNKMARENAFNADADPTAKAITKPVKDSADLMDGFGLNYSKGEAILSLVESMIGEREFQQAIQNYMRDNAWGSTTANDLWQVLSDKSLINIPAMMQTYLQQPAYPLLTIKENGQLSQQRFHFAGAEVDEQIWHIPLALSYKKDNKVHRLSVLMKDSQKQVGQLAEAEWVFPDDNAMSYFRWQIPEKQMTALLNDLNTLNGREKKSLLYNSDALLKAGRITIAQHMRVLEALVQDTDPMIARAVVATLNDLTYLVNDNNKAQFAAFLEGKLLPWFDVLGARAKPDDSDDVARLRQAVFNLLANYTRNARVMEVSKKLTDAFLKDTSSVSRELAYVAMRAMAKAGHNEYFESYLQGFKTAQDPNVKDTFLNAMSFPDKTLTEKVLDLGLTKDVAPGKLIAVLYFSNDTYSDRDVIYQWLEENLDKVVDKMPHYHVTILPEITAYSCSIHNKKLAEKFYKEALQTYPQMGRSYEVWMSKTQQCIDLKKLHQADFDKALSAYAE